VIAYLKIRVRDEIECVLSRNVINLKTRVRDEITAAHQEVLLFLCEVGRGRVGNDERFKRVAFLRKRAKMSMISAEPFH
jgi:hypothetical protein